MIKEDITATASLKICAHDGIVLRTEDVMTKSEISEIRRLTPIFQRRLCQGLGPLVHSPWRMTCLGEGGKGLSMLLTIYLPFYQP